MRRLAGALLAAGIATVPLAAAPPAGAQAAQCVALVVDRAPGSYSIGCVTWSAGVTGTQVLQRAGHTIEFRRDGLVCKIDGYPGGACGADATHYWSYWHRAPGVTSWSYSTEGPATYQPAANSTEGWAYQNGASRQPAAVAFGTICPPPAPPPASSSAPPQPAPTRVASLTPPATSPNAAPGRTTTRPGAGTASRPARTPTGAATSASPASATPADSALAGARSTGVGAAGPTGASGGGGGSGGGAVPGVVAGLALAAGLGGAGWWFARRRAAAG
jgi:hypothetical protein